MFFLSLAAAGSAIGRSWTEPQFPMWTDDFVDRMLSDSPWAKPSTVSFRLESALPAAMDAPKPGYLPRVGRSAPAPAAQGTGSRAEIFLTTRWATALPVRQALAITQYGRDGLDSPEAVDLLTRQEKEYVIEVAGFPTILFKKGARALEEALLGSARLSLAGRPAVAPTLVTVPDHGMHLMATLRFPRFEDLQPGDGTVTLAGSATTINFEQAFKLKSMVYQSKLEL